MAAKEAALQEVRQLAQQNLVINDSDEVSPYNVGYHDGMQRLAREIWEILETHVPEEPQ